LQDAGGLTTYAVNNLNQYSSVGGVSHTYDNTGKLTSDGTNTYVYDAENRLISAETADHSITYTYDPQGRRISKDVDGKVTKYLYDGDQVICEYDGSGRLMRKFIYGTDIDEPVRMTVLHPSADIGGGGDTVDIEDIRTMAAAWLTEVGEGGFNADADLSFDGKIDNVDSDILSENWQTGGSRAAQHYYFHFDGLGNVVALTDSAGNTIETYAYDVYGRADKPSSVGNPYFFTARRFDTETKLYYYRARYYSPTLGRFLQVDAIGYQDGMNLYAYCSNNSIIFVDPLGNKWGRRMMGRIYDNPFVTIETEDGVRTTYKVATTFDLKNVLRDKTSPDNKITYFEVVGHGIKELGSVAIGETSVVGENGQIRALDEGSNVRESLDDVINDTFAPDAEIRLEVCYVTGGSHSVAEAFKEKLPQTTVKGYPSRSFATLVRSPTDTVGLRRLVEVKNKK